MQRGQAQFILLTQQLQRETKMLGKDNSNAKPKIQDVIDALQDIASDNTVPRNIKGKIEATLGILRENTELSIRVNRAQNGLDEIADDINLQPYTRTQIWNVVSMLEKFS